MRKLLVAALIAVLLVAADQGARVFAQSELRKRAGAAVPEAAAVHAKVSSFPFVGQLVVSGRVTEVALRFDGIRSSRLQLHEVALDLRVVGGVMRLGPSGLAGLATAAAEGGRLALRFAGLPAASVVIPRGDLVPCQPLVAVTSAGVRLSCTFTHIPPRLIGAVNRAGATAP